MARTEIERNGLFCSGYPNEVKSVRDHTQQDKKQQQMSTQEKEKEDDQLSVVAAFSTVFRSSASTNHTALISE